MGHLLFVVAFWSGLWVKFQEMSALFSNWDHGGGQRLDIVVLSGKWHFCSYFLSALCYSGWESPKARRIEGLSDTELH